MDSALSASTFLDRARILIAQHRYELAEEHLARALEFDPDDADVYDLLAICLMHLGDAGAAHRSARRVIELAPTSPGGYIRHAWTILCDPTFVPSKPRWWQPRLTRASAAEQDQRARLREAIRLLDEALRIDPTSPFAWRLLAVAWTEGKEAARALEAVTKALEFAPRDVELHDLRAATLATLGRKEESAAATREALRIDPEHAQSLRRRGIMLLHEGVYAEALDCLVSAVRRDPLDETARAPLFDAMQTQRPLFRWAYRVQAPLARRGFFRADNVGAIMACTIVPTLIAQAVAAGSGAPIPPSIFHVILAIAIAVPLLLMWLRHASRFVLTFHPQARRLLPAGQRVGSHFMTYLLPALLVAVPLHLTSMLEPVPLIVLSATLPLAVATAQIERTLRTRFFVYAISFFACMSAAPIFSLNDGQLASLFFVFWGIVGAIVPYVAMTWVQERRVIA